MNTALQPRAGLLGIWDRTVGPGMSPAESLCVLFAGLIGGMFAILRLLAVGYSWWLAALGGMVAFDVIGGAVCNATDTTKAWYSRPSQGLQQRLLFIAPHLLYVVLVAWLWRQHGFDVTYFEVAGGVLAASAAVILMVPRRLKRPVAFGLYLSSLFTVTGLVGLTSGLEWFMPALLLKLLVGYLVPEVAN